MSMFLKYFELPAIVVLIISMIASLFGFIVTLGFAIDGDMSFLFPCLFFILFFVIGGGAQFLLFPRK